MSEVLKTLVNFKKLVGAVIIGAYLEPTHYVLVCKHPNGRVEEVKALIQWEKEKLSPPPSSVCKSCH